MFLVVDNYRSLKFWITANYYVGLDALCIFGRRKNMKFTFTIFDLFIFYELQLKSELIAFDG